MVNINQSEDKNEELKLSPLGTDEINSVIKSFKNSTFNQEELYKKDEKNFVKKTLFDLAKESERISSEENQSKTDNSSEENAGVSQETVKDINQNDGPENIHSFNDIDKNNNNEKEADHVDGAIDETIKSDEVLKENVNDKQEKSEGVLEEDINKNVKKNDDLITRPVVSNVLIMLNGMSFENGGTLVVPGSHKFGRHPNKKLDKKIVPIAAEGPPGCAIITDGRLWHGTGANISDKERLAILITFCGPQFRPQENYTLGLKKNIFSKLTDYQKERLGFKVWNGYGRIGDPTDDFLNINPKLIGELKH